MWILFELILIYGNLSFHEPFHCYNKFPKKITSSIIPTAGMLLVLVFVKFQPKPVPYYNGNLYLRIFFNTAV